jgi:hypothetical protein
VTPILATASWAPLVQTIVGAFIGAGGAIAGGTFSSWFAQQKERQAIAAALAAEVQCVVEAENWHDARKTLEQGRVPNAEQTSPEIFDANRSKIGLLPPDLAAKVVVFYSDLGGIVQDFRTLYAVRVKEEYRIRNADEITVRVLQRMHALEGRARALVAELRKEAARQWYYYLQPTE